MSRYRDIIPYQRVFVIVLDSLGIGSAQDAADQFWAEAQEIWAKFN